MFSAAHGFKGYRSSRFEVRSFLFCSEDPDLELKIIDFGLSNYFAVVEALHEAVGALHAVASEVIRYDEKCDAWAIGVITCLLLSGDPPFSDVELVCSLLLANPRRTKI